MHIIISDTHLGSKRCKHDLLLNFLLHYQNHPSLTSLILNGDILDIERITYNFYLPSTHIQILNILEDLYSKNKLVWIAGNHELNCHYYNSIPLSKFFILNYNQKQFLFLHGHDFAPLKFLKPFESFLDDLYFDHPQNYFLKKLRKTKLNYINNLEELAAKKYGKDIHTIFLGHSHNPRKLYFPNQYNTIVVNSGDWTGNNTFIKLEKGVSTLYKWTELGEVKISI